jgi:hypothetical protein
METTTRLMRSSAYFLLAEAIVPYVIYLPRKTINRILLLDNTLSVINIG